MIDTGSIEQGIDYEDLPQSYIVFICTFNPFESGRHLYTFTNLCIEEPTLSLGDKTQKVFLCTEGDKEDVSSEIMDFLDYVAGRKLEGKIAKELDAEVKNAREKEEWRAEYMQNMAAIMDAKREGRAEGRAEGKAEGMDNLSKLINHLPLFILGTVHHLLIVLGSGKEAVKCIKLLL